MSVINQMLKDLERRRQQGLDQGGVLDGLGMHPDRQRRAKWPLLIGLLVVVVAVSGWLAYEYGVRQARQPVAVADTVIKQPAAVVREQPVAVIEPLPEPEPATTTPLEQPAPAGEAMADPVSTEVPIASNAIEPAPTPAPQVETIAAAQIKRMSPTPLPANGQRSDLEILGSGFVEPLQVYLAWSDGAQQKQLDAGQVAVLGEDRLRLTFNPGSQSDNWSVWVINASGNSSEHYRFSVEAVANTEVAPAVEPTAPQSNQVIKTVRQRSPAERAQQQLDRAGAMLAQGNATGGEKLLREALELSPQLHQARELLAGMLFQQRRNAEAGAVLDAGVALGAVPISSTLLRARIYAELQQEAEAIRVLESARPALNEATDYYALLAALYQRQARHAEAVQVYSQLVRINPRQGVWQMGLAISYEALGQREAAVSTYQAALAAGLQPELREYVGQRLRALK